MASPCGRPDSSPSSGSSVTSFNKNRFVVVFAVVVFVRRVVGGRLVEVKILRVVDFVGIETVEVGMGIVEEEEEILRGCGVPTSIQRLSSACGPFDAIRIGFVIPSFIFGGHRLVVVVVVVEVVVEGVERSAKILCKNTKRKNVVFGWRAQPQKSYYINNYKYIFL
jgi:hypothetical protein